MGRTTTTRTRTRITSKTELSSRRTPEIDSLIEAVKVSLKTHDRESLNIIKQLQSADDKANAIDAQLNLSEATRNIFRGIDGALSGASADRIALLTGDAPKLKIKS